MIKLGDEWSVKKDTHGWTLTRHYEGKDKKGNPKLKEKNTYHANLKQALTFALDYTCGACSDAAELRKFLADAESWIVKWTETPSTEP